METINVIQTNTKTQTPIIIGSFNTSSKGIILAEELFIKTCRSINDEIEQDYVEQILDDGVYYAGELRIDLHWSNITIVD
jgi:hypothetical protein